MKRAAFVGAIVLAVVSAGCTGGVGGALSLNKATLADPSFDLSPEKGDAKTVFSVDSRGLADKYNVTWEWGDGTLSYGPKASHTYGFTNGVMTITLLATDASGQQGIATKQVTLGSGINKEPRVSARASRAWIEVGQTTNISASGSDPDRDPLVYAWSVGPADAPAQRTLDETTSRVPVSFDAPGKYVVTVRAQDRKGGEAVSTVNVTVSRSIPSARFEQTFTGTIAAGSGGAGLSEQAWAASAVLPDSNVDSSRHTYTLDYPASTLIFLTWNDTSTQGAFDLDLELRHAGNGTVVFTSATRAPAAPFEFNITQQDAGDYEIIVRGVVGADVVYTLLLQSTLRITPELVAAREGA